MDSFKDFVARIESVLAHELQHAWNYYEGEKRTGAYIGDVKWQNDLKELFPFI